MTPLSLSFLMVHPLPDFFLLFGALILSVFEELAVAMALLIFEPFGDAFEAVDLVFLAGRSVAHSHSGRGRKGKIQSSRHRSVVAGFSFSPNSSSSSLGSVSDELTAARRSAPSSSLSSRFCLGRVAGLELLRAPFPPLSK